MKKYQCFCQFVRPPKAKAERHSGKGKTSMVGYVPLEDRIREMMAAGVRLQAARDAAYDIPSTFVGNEEDVEVDPTRKPGFDYADASAVAASLNEKHRKVTAAAKAAAGVKKAPVEPQKAPVEPVKDPPAKPADK